MSYNNLGKFKGIFPIIYCFFNKNNSLDKKIISEQINLINKIGSNGIASLGLATEVNKLSFQEKKIIIEMVSKYSNGSIPTAVTIQGNSFEEYLRLIEIAKYNEATWIILQPLIKKNTKDKDCFDFFNKLIPYTKGTLVGVQNAKEYLGVGLSSKDIIKLYKKYENFRAIKGESSSVFMENEIKQYPKNLSVFNGRGGQEIVDNFLIGCKGIVPALELDQIDTEIKKIVPNNRANVTIFKWPNYIKLISHVESKIDKKYHKKFNDMMKKNGWVGM